MCLTFILKVNHQGQVTYFGFPEILDIVNVRIDTKIKKYFQKIKTGGQNPPTPWAFSVGEIPWTSEGCK